MNIFQAKNYITHVCDGPLTDFVVISRGCKLIKEGCDPDIVANAIIETLNELGFIPDNNNVVETGS